MSDGQGLFPTRQTIKLISIVCSILLNKLINAILDRKSLLRIPWNFLQACMHSMA